MGVGTKNRQKQTAELCKRHLRERYRDKLALVEEFIVEFEGIDEAADLPRWSMFTDVKRSSEEMLLRLDEHFEAWLNPPPGE